MKIKIKPFSRLTLIFILAVTIPGGILSYLSIQNITNLKELAERRVLEEEEELGDLIYQNFQNKLLDISNEFTHFLSEIKERDPALIRYANKIDFIENPFIIDQNGVFLWPRFISDIAYKGESISDDFTRTLKAAEQYEFADQNNSRALSQYLRAYGLAKNKSDSARSLNAIARVSDKTNDKEQALKYYAELISGFYAVLDRNGLPYINYAIPQFIRLSDTSNAIFILDKINFVLSKMASGEIPLNYSTEILIDEISTWISSSPFFTQEDSKEAVADIYKIECRYTFLMQNSELIRNFALERRGGERLLLVEDYYFLPIPAQKEGESIIIARVSGPDFISGFTLNLDSLALYSTNVTIPSNFRFKYEVEIIDGNIKPLLPEGDLSVFSNWSPIAHDKSFKIKLKDEHLLAAQITRTSWIYGIAIVLLIGGMILGVFLIIRDINRERYLSQLRSDFVSNVTHELKTPLTSIYMFAESILLGRVKTESDQKEYLRIILKETERLKRLINNILDFSKREKGKLTYHFIKVNISDLIQSAIDELDYWTGEKQFKVTKNIEENITGQADPDSLKQAIINLLSNAIKYSRDRKEIDVRLWQDEELIYIEVEDKGIGIPEDKIDQIFDKFYRIENEDAPENTGTGLGLTVVKDILEAHNARIMVESIIGRGSKFTIVLSTIK